MGLCLAMAGLSSCVDREEMNATLANSCQTGVASLLGEYVSIKTVKDTGFSTVADKRDGDTKITLKAIVDDNNLDVERSYSCNFFVKTGFLNNSFSANISQIDMGDGDVYGRKEGEIRGGMNKWMDITKEAESAL